MGVKDLNVRDRYAAEARDEHAIKLDKVLYIIYVNIKSLMKKMDRYANNPEKSSTTKIDKHIPCEYSMSNIWVIDDIENKNSVKVLRISKRT